MSREDVPDAELRCECGRLLAQKTDAGIELRCTRCKRTVLIRCQLQAGSSLSLEELAPGS